MMRKRKIAGWVSALVLGALSTLSETKAMEEEGGEDPLGKISDDCFCPRPLVPCDGRVVTLSRIATGSQLRRIHFLYEFGSQAIVIPACVEELGEGCFAARDLAYVAFEWGSRLQGIGVRAFFSSKLSSFCVPSGVETLSPWCFSGCFFLSDFAFEFGSRLQEIGVRAFSRSGNLQSVCIPSSVVALREFCFYQCKTLTFVTFPPDSRLQVIEHDAFVEARLRDIIIPGGAYLGNGVFNESPITSIEVRSRAGNPFISRPADICSGAYMGTGILSKVVIPQAVVILWCDCFAHCVTLTDVSFEEDSQLTWIEEGVFSDSGLQSFVVPWRVEKIGSGCFEDCKFLTSLSFEADSQLTRIEIRVFACSALEDIVLPKSVAILDRKCFCDCQSLSHVAFESGSQLVRIEEDAFSGSPAWVVLPNGEIYPATQLNWGWTHPSVWNFCCPEPPPSMGDLLKSWVGVYEAKGPL
jgi:hypothetical protein